MTAVHQLESTLRSLKLGGMLDTLEVRLVQAHAGELGIQESTLGRWVHDFRARAAAGEAGQGGLSETERAELLRLRRENSDLKLDRAFLKKASLFFAQEASDTNGKRSS